MAVAALMSAKGSPGVTTTTVALALAWAGANPGRTAIAVDSDPIGGDTAAGVLAGAAASPAGMLPLAMSRGVDPVTAIDMAAVDLVPGGAARLLPGVPDEARAPALTLAWDVIGGATAGLDRNGTARVVDAGREDGAPAEAPWLACVDVCALLVRPTLPAVTSAHRFARRWPYSLPPLHLVVVDAPSPYRAAEAGDAVHLPLLGVLPHDPRAARVFSEGAPATTSSRRGAHARAVAGLAGDLWALASARRAFIGIGGAHGS